MGLIEFLSPARGQEIVAETKRRLAKKLGKTTDAALPTVTAAMDGQTTYFNGVIYKANGTTLTWEPQTYSKDDVDAICHVESTAGFTGTDGTFYVPTGTPEDPAYDHYDENGHPLPDLTPEETANVAEKIADGTYEAGSKELDMSGYIKESDLHEVTAAEAAAWWDD